jgi:hypothetical protein
MSPVGKRAGGMAPEVTGAVVATATANDAPASLLICTEELDRLHVGGGVTVGVMAHVNFTVPVNDPVGMMAKLKLVVCPALTVWEVDDPEEAPRVKPGTVACMVRVTAMLCTSLPDVP